MTDKKLTLIEHLEELRFRILKSVISVLALSILIYNFTDDILPYLAGPVGKLVFVAPQEAFITNLKIAIFGGIFLASPYILFQIWRFVGCGLNEKEKRYVLFFAPLSFIFFLCGVLFGFYIIVPLGIRFLLGFATDFVNPMITVGNYISFMWMLTFTFGLIFELPLIMAFLTKLGVVNPLFLLSRRREVVVIIFVMAAFLTPPDVITQILMALPLLLLYELGIIFSKISYKRPHIKTQERT